MRTWITIIITTGSMLLAVGYNWRRVDEVAGLNKATSEAVQNLGATYVRQDVHSMQLQDINRQLSEIKDLLQAEHGTTYGRRFDK